METHIKKRNANMELLRIISMVMVTFLHAIVKSGFLVQLTEENMVNPNTWISLVFEILSVGAVDIFILISGYFLVESEFKTGRLIELVLQTCVYSLGAFIIALCLGIVDRSEVNVYVIRDQVFPVHMEMFWFVTTYILIYILQPILAAGIKAISRKKLEMLILIGLIYECFLKSILPIRLDSGEEGYSFFWFLLVFVIGAYFRLYGFGFLNSVKRGWLLFFICSALNLLVITGVQHVIIYLGHLNELYNFSLDYNHVLVIGSAVGIFSAFANMKQGNGKAAGIICALSPMTLGVYLIHENLTVRYRWQEWLGLGDIWNSPWYVFTIRLLAAVLAVYCIGTVVDYLRIQLFKAVKKLVRKN